MAQPGRRAATNQRNNNDSSGKAFNPRLIFSQIVAMQCFHYVVLGFLVQVNYVIFGTSITLDRVFTDEYVGLWTAAGWADTLAILIASLVGSVLLAVIVEKSKKCLDFSVTLFMIHFILCTLYKGVPRTWDWYIVHVLGTVFMVLFGEYLCSRRELDDIPLLQIWAKASSIRRYSWAFCFAVIVKLDPIAQYFVHGRRFLSLEPFSTFVFHSQVQISTETNGTRVPSASLFANHCVWHVRYLADAILKLRLTRVHTPQQDDLFQNAPQCPYRYCTIHTLTVHPEHHTFYSLLLGTVQSLAMWPSLPQL